jgi:AcrR family transcriptional regulator
MAVTRRPGDESRALLIEAAAGIINSEGYAALSARRLAEKVGLKRQIVHYYFRTMDDLLLAVIRHYGEEGLARFSQAFASGDPLRVIWETRADASATTFAFMAMATHSQVIKAELRRYLEAFRELQVEAVTRYMTSAGLEATLPAEAAVIILQSVSQALAAEAALGTRIGHERVKEVVEQWLSLGAFHNGELMKARRP